MSERKVLNKYYPPDFDPNKIPKMKIKRNGTFTIRIMAPFNMRCNTCGEYIYKGKKFNSRKEDVNDEDYLGLRIFRFYIRCPRCIAEIAFKTDPENTDYTLEAGATRNFEALRTAEIQARRELAEKEAEEANNPMKLLEKRTEASQREMENLETLEDLRNLNARQAFMDHDTMLEKYAVYEAQLKRLQDEEDEALVNKVFGRTEGGGSVKRIVDDNAVGAADTQAKLARTDGVKGPRTEKVTDPLVAPSRVKAPAPWERSVGVMSGSKGLGGLVKRKAPASATSQCVGPSHPTPHTGATSQLSEVTASIPGQRIPQPSDVAAILPEAASKSLDDASHSTDDAPKVSMVASQVDVTGVAMTSRHVCESPYNPCPDKPNVSSDATPLVTPSANGALTSSRPSVVTSVGKTSSLGLLACYSGSASDSNDSS